MLFMLIFATDLNDNMYAYLEGKFTMKNAAQVYVDINGVGYELNISLNTYAHIQNLDKGKLYTYLQIKEDGHTLYGFFDKEEKEIFIQLISVSGVGASTARMMLSHLKPAEVSKAIVQNNVKLLESVKGIGKKTAERLVLELRDKVTKAVTDLTIPVTAGNRLQQDALNALVSLGISRPQAESAIQKINHTEPDINNLEELIKKALKAI
jgi:Holliday junction DNA helicase RuvA